MEMTTIYFDMDGTIADSYGIESWLEDILMENPRPYRQARPLVNMRKFVRIIHKLQAQGCQVGIITWLGKGSSNSYNNKVASAKMNWLKAHCGSVNWDDIIIVEYGTPKHELVEIDNSILFDDEITNRIQWELNGGIAYGVENILENLGLMF